MNHVVAIVGMTGSGKSEVARMFREKGFVSVRFGDLTDEKVKEQGLSLNEANERQAREALRKEHGMDAYAKLSIPRIDAGLKTAPVAVDGLYSWEEYKLLKDYYSDCLVIVAVWSSPKMRYARLATREIRPLTPQEARSRDYAEVENLNKGGPISMADYTILNDGSLDDMRAQIKRLLEALA